MPAEGIVWRKKAEILSYEEILRIAGIFVKLGIDKIRLTGGEPLVRRDIEDLVAGLAKLDGLKTLAMTTNAVLLKDKAPAMKASGMHALNISLDTLRKERFLEVTKRDNFDQVIEGIEAAINSHFDSIKLNVVVMSGVNDDEILDFVHYVKDTPINVRFIEYMPFKDNDWSADSVLTYKQMKDMIGSQFELEPISGHAADTAKDFQIVGHTGRVSFITSMSDSFCSTCNRLRLTADGFIKSCLFYDGEINLRDELRAGASDADLANLIEQAVINKPEAHPPMEELALVNNRTMIEIGG
jgi:cyclic pyranopterin phosphate synthase